MTVKKVLIALLSLQGLVGMSAIGAVLIESMSPSQRTKAERSQHNVSSLAPGKYRLEKFYRKDWKDWLHAQTLLIRNWDNDLHVYLLPANQDGAILMPERWWSWGYYHCQNFGPDLDENGKIAKDGAIRCHDEGLREWEKEEWVWHYSGQAFFHWKPDLFTPGFDIAGNTIYINR